MSQKHEQATVVLEVDEPFKKLRGREDLSAKSSWKMAQIACNDRAIDSESNGHKWPIIWIRKRKSRYRERRDLETVLIHRLHHDSDQIRRQGELWAGEDFIVFSDNVWRIDEFQLTTYQRLNNPARRAASLKQTRC